MLLLHRLTRYFPGAPHPYKYLKTPPPTTNKYLRPLLHQKHKKFMAAHSIPPNTLPSPPSLEFVAPKPLESLHETPIPPFLSKAYDLVDDPSLDSIISWGDRRGNSFVVWQPVEFARSILPMNFKHNNFSSFVRQLNTYGFRKIDTDKWEFTNEGFVRGQRHLLKKIQRRRSHHPHQLCNEDGKAISEGEIKELRRERRLMMQEVSDLQHQQRGTVERIEIVKEKLVAAERRQKQLISFLARLLDKHSFLPHPSEQKSIASPRTMRRFVKHQPTLSIAENWARTVEDRGEEEDELAMVNELLHTPEKGPTLQPLVEEDGMMNPTPNDVMGMEIGVPELLMAGNETGDAWGVGLEAGTCGYTNDPWGCLNSNNMLDLGVGCELSELGLMQQGGSSDMNMNK